MNSVNASMGYALFMLKSSHHPRLIPSIVHLPEQNPVAHDEPMEDANATPLTLPSSLLDLIPLAFSFMEDLHNCLADTLNSLLATKLSQTLQVNASQNPEPNFEVGNKVLLSTENRRYEYTQKKEGHVAKFMPHFNGPYTITKAFPQSSIYTLHLPALSHAFPSFHASLLKKYNKNDLELFLNRELSKPGPIVTPDGQDKYFIKKILDERKCGRGHQYLVHWLDYGPESDLWLPCLELLKTEALETWDVHKR